ncbi:hypothetical protein OB69_14095 [Roseivirga seohaensis subsp. aquiponti]|uniref:DUF4149 domain-containing protein n=1 Tax=Roseivirga seohaensis subsp. aquiponti TaxID=1566026 RepID=A0A0L8AIC7_9BACT|nr:hypothetical protein [Roseivirga seohaensis]KOF02148.1 hypothetical protein OB69_14095 [Roseivirga seohaensis subsp. aquiponti]
MTIQVKSPIAVVSVFLWIGFVCAISFMEAWLKFQAPGITLSLGLGIGRLVFGALNKVEWVFAIAIGIQLVIHKAPLLSTKTVAFLLPLLLLFIQTLWLLPALDARAEMYIEDIIPPASNLHFYYAGAEVIKVICLLIYGITQFKKTDYGKSY